MDRAEPPDTGAKGEEVRLAVLAAERRVRVFDAEYGGDITRLNAIELQDLHDAYYLLGLDEHADEIKQELRFRHDSYPKLAALESRFGRGKPGLTFRERMARAREMEFFTAYQNGEAWAVDASRAAFDAHVREMRADTKKATAVLARGRERRSPQCRTTRRSFAVTSRRSRDSGGGEPGEPEPARRRHWAGCGSSSTCVSCGSPLIWHGGVLICPRRGCERWGRPA